MNTALVYGNGNLLVNENDHLYVSDLYWPHVGQENHLAKFPNEIFVYVDGKFSYFTDPGWEINPKYRDDALVSDSVLINRELELEIHISSAVLPYKDIFLRVYELKNLADRQRSVILYEKNNFYMLEDDLGNTAIWYPIANLMCHYKKNRYIGIGSSCELYQYTCAAPADNNGRGAVPNEKGELNFNPVSTGSAQSCLSRKFDLAPKGSANCDSFMACGKSFEEISSLAEYVRKKGTNSLIDATEVYWINWVRPMVDKYFENKAPELFGNEAEDKKLFDLYKRSLLIIRSQFDNSGSIIAANDSTFVKAGGKDTYSYFWPRDGAMVSLALIDVGFTGLVKKFFRVCKQIINTDGYILHKYYPNVSDGLASSWHPWVDKGGNLQLPIQEDETALVLHALWKHHEKSGDQEFLNEMWDSFIVPAGDFLMKYRYSHDLEQLNVSDFVHGYSKIQEENPLDSDYKHSGLPRPSYDPWEIERGIFTYTVASVYSGLIAAAKLAELHGDSAAFARFIKAAEEIKAGAEENLLLKQDNRFVKSIICDPVGKSCMRDTTLDASLVALWKFGMYDVNDDKVKNTMKAIEEKLWVKTDVGGFARKENDWYHRDDSTLQGNPWSICTLWMAQYAIKLGDMDKARQYLKWVMDHADITGLMGEQSDPHTGFSKSVKPLTWSHAEFVTTVNLLKTMTTEKN